MLCQNTKFSSFWKVDGQEMSVDHNYVSILQDTKFHTMSTNTLRWKSHLHTRLSDTAITRSENEVYNYIE